MILTNTVNANCISKKYECSSRTIHRDIVFMRDNLDLPIAYDKKRKSFYYSKRIFGNYWKVETMKKFLERLNHGKILKEK